MGNGEATAPRGGALYVWAAILIFAAANSVVRLLSELGAAHPVEGRNAISFCNLLFVGNLCAFVALVAIFWRSWRPSELKALTRKDWAGMAVVALLSTALAPSLLFMALEVTTVTNVVLIGRIEPPLLMLLSFLVFREKVDRWALMGTALSVLGVVLIVLLKGDGLELGRGEAYAAASTTILVVSTLFSKAGLKRVPLGVFTVFRTGLGTIAFFIAAIYLFGADHFQDAFAPFLWQWMLVYGTVIVVGGQLCWFKGIASSDSATVSLISSFSPVAGVLFAMVLLGERPDMSIMVGGAVIVAGIALAQIGGFVERRAAAKRERASAEAVRLEGDVNFKGV